MKNILNIIITISILFSEVASSKRENKGLYASYNPQTESLNIHRVSDRDLRSIDGVEPTYTFSSLEEALEFVKKQKEVCGYIIIFKGCSGDECSYGVYYVCLTIPDDPTQPLPVN